MNVSNLAALHVFSLSTFINCKQPPNEPRSTVIQDIILVLGAIPRSNKLTNLLFDFTIFGPAGPFSRFLEQDWVVMFHEVIRIADGKPLELELHIIFTGTLDTGHPEQDELFVDIMEKAAMLSDYPNICTHVWNPTGELGPFPRGQVRNRCRR